MARSEEFAEGYEKVRAPQFQSVQQQHNRNFQATSVLDNIMPNSNGMGAPDFQRRMVGYQNSATGRSQGTYDKELWLRHQEPSQRVKYSEGRQNG